MQMPAYTLLKSIALLKSLHQAQLQHKFRGQIPTATTPSSSWRQAGHTEHQGGPHSQVNTQSACITHPQKMAC